MRIPKKIRRPVPPELTPRSYHGALGFCSFRLLGVYADACGLSLNGIGEKPVYSDSVSYADGSWGLMLGSCDLSVMVRGWQLMLRGICIFEFHGYGRPGTRSRILYTIAVCRDRSRSRDRNRDRNSLQSQ
jgi:hypothetical protein